MVVVGNVIALLMVAGDILGLIGSYLGILGVTTTALAGVIIADYFIVRKRPGGRPARDRGGQLGRRHLGGRAALLGGVLQRPG